MSVRSDFLVRQALWPALLLAVLSYVTADFLQHPFLGVPSDAAVAPQPHLTLWLAQTEASEETSATVREAADSMMLYGRAATVAELPGGASRAVVQFYSQPRSAGDLLVISSSTVAELAQERASTLVGEEPMRAARAQRLLARAIPVGMLSGDPLTIAVSPSSGIDSVEQLLRELHEAPQRHVFAITSGSWATDNLAALVQDAGTGGVVPYRVFPLIEEASLALTAGSADVVMAPRSTILPELRAHTLRALEWPAAAGRSPSSWVELLAAPGAPPARVAQLRRQLSALSRDAVWRALLRRRGQGLASGLSGAQLRRFLLDQGERVAELQKIDLRIERH